MATNFPDTIILRKFYMLVFFLYMILRL